jgi:hypothetical protein
MIKNAGLWHLRILIMKNKREKLSTFLALLISFLLIACSGYSHYNKLMEIDFLSSHSSFENPDLEGLLADKQDKAKIFVQSSSSVNGSLSFFGIEPFPQVSSPILSSLGSISILRC